MAPGFRLDVQRALFPVEVSVLGVLHLGITHIGIQEQTIEQFFFFIHCRKKSVEFLLRVGFRRLLGVVKFCQDFASAENVPCPQERVQSFEDVVNRSIVQIALMLP
ncbi:MAG TPA: hypothetical protein VEV41_04370 [Terriglobales bacterium]|nr:hypothetical protein [Terriglobales bacterium]